MAAGTEPKDYEQILFTLTAAGLPYFVEGGQAVNIWSELFGEQVQELQQYRPYTSKDCDLWIGFETFEKLRDGLLDEAGNLIVGDSPVDGQLGVFTINGLPERVIDLMQGVYGIPPGKIETAFERSLDVGGIRVLDPLFLFKGKCHNFTQLNQSHRQDEKHIRMLALVLPVYFEFLLTAALRKEITQRSFIKEIKLFRAFTKDGWIRQALSALSLELDEMIPIASLKSCGLSVVERYANRSWPS